MTEEYDEPSTERDRGNGLFPRPYCYESMLDWAKKAVSRSYVVFLVNRLAQRGASRYSPFSSKEILATC